MSGRLAITAAATILATGFLSSGRKRTGVIIATTAWSLQGLQPGCFLTRFYRE